MNRRTQHAQPRWIWTIVLCVLLSVPLYAQESTPESSLMPEIIITEAPTEVPVIPTVLPVEPITPEETVFPSETAPESTPSVELTLTETALPPTEPALMAWSEDFEAFDAVGWALNGWTTRLTENGTILEASTPNSIAEWGTPLPVNLALSVAVRVPIGEVALIHVNGYTVMLDSRGNSRLYQGETLLENSQITESPLRLDPIWETVTLTLQDNVFSVSIDGVLSLTHVALTPFSAGFLAFSTGDIVTGTLEIDHLTVTELLPTGILTVPTATPTVEQPILLVETAVSPESTPEAVSPESTSEAVSPESTPEAVSPESTSEAVSPESTEAPLATLAPESTPEALLNKLNGSLAEIAQAQQDGDLGVINTLLLYHGYEVDEFGRFSVEIGATSFDSIAPLTDQVIALNGEVTRISGDILSARIDASALVVLSASPHVFSMRKPVSATSTDTLNAPLDAPAGTLFSDGFNAIGANDWHSAGILGAGVRIGVIDTGFGTSAPAKSGEYACINTASIWKPAARSFSSNMHGRNVVEILCDIAPSALVYMYQVSDYGDLYEAVNRARTVDSISVLVIALDLGVDASAGDGLGRGGANDPYAEIALARNAGMAIFASAGNNGNPAHIGNATKAPRYLTFSADMSAGTNQVNMQVSAGDIIRFSWNDWGANNRNFSVSLSGDATSGAFGRLTGTLPSNVITVPTSAQCQAVANDTCNVTLNITPSAGTGTAIFQVQITPALASGETTQSSAVYITGHTLAGASAVVANAGTLARPADSPNVISVGAVCASQESNFASLPTASVGPVFGAGGGLPTASQPYLLNEIKPNIVAPSHVTVSSAPVANAADCDGTLSGSDSAGGFGGSSAAVAHAAGMAALLRSSNLPTVNPSMNTFSTVSAIENYMHTRVVDLPLDAPDGFDMTYGSGAVALGFPQFDMTKAQTFASAPNNISCAGGFSYVSMANPSTENLGTLAQPFLHIGNALNNAPSQSCVVVMPGEYLTPVLVSGVNNNVTLISYDQASSADTANSLFRVVGQYYIGDISSHGSFTDSRNFPDNGGVYIDNGANDFTLSGFNFSPSTFIGGIRRDAVAVVVKNGDSVTVSHNTFGTQTIDGKSYSGWVNSKGHPVSLFGGTTTLFKNVFNGLVGTDNAVVGAVIIVNATSAILSQNEFLNNNVAASQSFSISEFKAIIYGERSAIDIVGNAFVGNQSATVLHFRNPTTNASEPDVRLVSNVFLDNDAVTSCGVGCEPKPPSGGIAHFYRVRDIFFVNNTVVSNDRGASGGDDANAVITRSVGNPDFFPNADRRVEFHNNIILDNGFSSGLMRYIDDATTTSTECSAITTANPVTNNRWSDTGPGLTGTPCSTDVLAQTNGNSLLQFLSNNFAGAESGFPYPVTDWRYYALRQIQQFSANPLAAATFSEGIDQGADINAIGLPVSGGNLAYPFDMDITGNFRVLNIQQPDPKDDSPADGISDYYDPDNPFVVPNIPYQNEGTSAIDLGAFEFTPLRIDSDGNENNGLQNTFNALMAEDDGYITVNVLPFALGGFGDLTFSISSLPRHYGTHCAPMFAGTQGVVLGEGLDDGKVFYCPPRDFYNSTDGTTLLNLNENLRVLFAYTVRDEVFSSATGYVDVKITPENDANLSAQIGDNIPDGDIFEVTLNADTSTVVKLRPYVDFTGNFTFSEEDNDEFGAYPSRQIDYPFAYSGATKTNTPSNVIAGLSLSGGDLTITAGGGRGIENVTYTVTDARGNITTHTIRVRVASAIPSEPALYDDSSTYFTYRQANANTAPTWSAVFSATNINNTLHNTSTFDDSAEFSFFGTGFILYMQAQGSGNDFMLTINGTAPDGNWTLQSGVTTTAMYKATYTPQGMECYTRALPTATTIANPLPKTLTNRGSAPYTITCYRTANAPTPDVYTVAVTNKKASGLLSIDGFSLLNDTLTTSQRVLNPGFYEVDSQELRSMFGAWTLTANRSYTNGLAYVTQNAGVPNVEFYIEGATGFSLVTTQDKAGATYSITVESTPGNSVTQTYRNDILGASTGLVYGVSRPFYGLDPQTRYKVTLDVTSIPLVGTTVGNMVFDGLVVYGPADQIGEPLPFGVTENDDLVHFVYGNPVEDNWTSVYNSTTASNKTLHSLTAGKPMSGAFVAFDIPDSANAVVLDYAFASTVSRRLMVCVDRAIDATTATNNARCATINLRPIAADRFTVQPTYAKIVQPVNGSLVVEESLFSTGWGTGSNGVHRIEIFSLINEAFSLDKITVLNTQGALSAGNYEDYVPNFQFYRSSNQATPFNTAFSTIDAVLVAPATYAGTIFYDARTNNYTNATAPFLRVTNTNANSDSGKSVTWTKDVGASIVFGFTGTGFAPRFRMDKDSDAVQICYQASTAPFPAPNDVSWDTATCATFDNESKTISYIGERPILGLPNNTYAVRIRMLADNNTPAPHPITAPLMMWFDGVTVYDNDFASMTEAEPDVTYEFKATTPDSRLMYLGDKWAYNYNTRNTLYSGLDYSTYTNKIGAGVVFRTTADALMINRVLARANMMVCSVVVATGDILCNELNNSGTGNLNFVTVPIQSGNQIVTLYASQTGTFTLDAIKPVMRGTTLTPGYYEEFHPAIQYVGYGWQAIRNTSYSGTFAQRSTVAGAEYGFSFVGTGFVLGTTLERDGGETEVCYDDTANFDGSGVAGCMTYQNERAAVSVYGARTIAGLPNGTYYVRVRDVENGKTVIGTVANVNRAVANAIGRLSLDYVHILGDEADKNNLALITQSLAVNQNHQIDNKPVIAFLPNTQWGAFTGAVTSFTQGNYAAPSLNSVVSSVRAGATGMMRLDLSAGATLTLVSDAPSTAKTDQLLVCVDGVSGNASVYNFVTKQYELSGSAHNCQLLNGFRTNKALSITLPSATSDSVVTFSSLVPASLVIDEVRIQIGTTLGEGYHETTSSALPTLPQTATMSFGFNTPSNWVVRSATTYSGGATLVLEDTLPGVNTTGTPITGSASELTFSIENATGLSLITTVFPQGGNFTVNFDNGGSFNKDYTLSNQSTSLVNQVALTIGGLPQDTYTVTITNVSALNIYLDAIQVYGGLQELGSIYDDQQRTPNGELLLNYGGGMNVWLAGTNATAIKSTISTASKLGATVSFVAGKSTPVENATGFRLYYLPTSTSAEVEICWNQLNANVGNRRCLTTTLADKAGSKLFDFNTQGSGDTVADSGRFGVTIVNRQNGKTIVLDAIEIIEAGANELRGGYYEETYSGTPNAIRQFNGSLAFASSATPVTSTLYSGSSALRFSAVNSGLYFRFKGTGFNVYFGVDTFSDSVKICYKADSMPYSVTVADILNTGNCQIVDNQTTRATYKFPRSVQGLPFGTYAVAVQHLGDNGTPNTTITRTPQIRMDIDAIEIISDVWFGDTETNWDNTDYLKALSPSMGRVETSFTNRAVDKLFFYYGTWSHLTGTAQKNYSGSNYDTTSQTGASLVFRTSGANALTLFTAPSTANTTVRMCATPLNLNPLVESGARVCRDYLLTGSGFQRPISFQFGGGVDEYVVSMTSLEAKPFPVDAIQVYDTTSPITTGTYDATDARIFYDATYTNFVTNGDMEVTNGSLPLGWSLTGGATSNTTTTRFNGGLARLVFAGTGGIEQALPALPAGTYTLVARVYVQAGGVRMEWTDGSNVLLPEFSTTGMTHTLPINQWVTLRQEVTFASPVSAGTKLRFLGTAISARFIIDGIAISQGGLWTNAYATTYYNQTAVISQTSGASATFTFSGTGFEIGMIADPLGGETEICYGVGTPNTCFIYQNELARANTTTSRTVVGLPFDTYTVRVRDLEDGKSTLIKGNASANRTTVNMIGKMALTYIRIYEDTLAPALTSGYYNENATDQNGNRYLQLYPNEKFEAFTGRLAPNYSQSSFYSYVSAPGRVSTTNAGQTAVLNVNKTSGENLTVVLYLGPNRAVTDQVLVCAGNSTTGRVTWNGTLFGVSPITSSKDCVLRTNAKTEAQLVVGASDLDALGGTTSGNVRITYTVLNGGRFDIDGYQVYRGNVLGEGIHDDFLPDELLNFSTSARADLNRAATGCLKQNDWCLQKGKGYGGFSAFTANVGATLTFTIEGTGFSVLTTNDTAGVPFRICYKRATNNAAFPAIGAEASSLNVNMSVGQSGNNAIWCENLTTRTSTTGGSFWNSLNTGRINPSTSNQYGFAYYGLPHGKYTVEVRLTGIVVPAVAPRVTADRLQIDAIAVFGRNDTLPTLTPGVYDDTHTAFSYEPAPLWGVTTYTAAPPTGAYQLSEITTKAVGAIAQVNVEGNSVILYQSTTTTSTRDARFCMAVTGATIHCTPQATLPAGGSTNGAWARAFQIAQFSQTASTTRFSPIMFYGLGEGEHLLIIENRDYNRALSIDAIRVQE